MKKSSHIVSYLFTIAFLLIFISDAMSSASGVPAGNSGPLNYSRYRKDIGITFNIGLNNSGEYKKVLTGYYGELTGGFSWLSLGIGADFRLVNNLFIEPQLSWFTHTLKVPSSLSGFNNDKINSILFTGIAAKYYIFFNRSETSRDKYFNLGLYINGGVYNCSPSSDLTDIKFTSAGIGKKLSLGIHCGEGIGSINLDIGKRWIPVKTNGYYSNDFGGIFAEVSGVIYILNYKGKK
jgi:hypothetical protein